MHTINLKSGKFQGVHCGTILFRGLPEFAHRAPRIATNPYAVPQSVLPSLADTLLRELAIDRHRLSFCETALSFRSWQLVVNEELCSRASEI